MPVVLYKYDLSPLSRCVNMVLELIGLEVEVKIVNSVAGQTSTPEFVAKNPVHAIPVIEDDDFTLADSHAIITYLVSKYGAENSELYPKDLRIRATVDQRLHLEGSILFPRFRAAVSSIVRQKAPGPSEQQVADIEEAYGFLEAYLKKTTFLAADHLTLADVSCVATVSSLDIVVPVDDKFPKLIKWFNSIKELEWYQKGNVSGLALLNDLVQGSLNES